MNILGSDKKIRRNNFHTFTEVSFNDVSSPLTTSIGTGGTEEFLEMCVVP